MQVLVCWQEIPNDTHFVILRGLTDEVYREVLSFNGEYINVTKEETGDKINRFFYDAAGEFRFEKHAGPILNWIFDAIIQTGIVL